MLDTNLILRDLVAKTLVTKLMINSEINYFGSQNLAS